MNNNYGRACEDSFIELRNVDKSFGKFKALKNVSLEIKEGEFVSALGPSGCGKTTLLRVIAGMETQDSGSVYLKGRDISRLHASKRNCGIVFQSYALFPNLTAEQNVEYGIRDKSARGEEKKRRAKELLAMVGLGDFERKYPAQLSGGQQQRVALARALAATPDILLLDEPLSALDAKVRVRLRHEIRSLQKRLGLTTVMVTHDQEEALTMADKIVVMRDGQIVRHASPMELYNNPGNPFVAGFIGSMNFIPYWKVEAGGAVSKEGLRLKVKKNIAHPLAGGDVAIGIRPEDIRLLKSREGVRASNTIDAIVESVEFRGSVYRARLRASSCMSDRGPAKLEAEFSAAELFDMNIQENTAVSVVLPEDRLLLFEDPQLEGMNRFPGACNI